MTTGQTMMVIFAFVVLTTILLSFNSRSVDIRNDMLRNQDRIVATSIAKSYTETAQGLEFDEVTMVSDTTLRTPAALTSPALLGKEAVDVTGMDDFDDLNNFASEEYVDDSTKIFDVECKVSYVDPERVDQKVNYRTFVKRLDVKVYRSDAGAPADVEADTIRMFSTSAYFRPTEGIIRPPAPPPPPPMPPPPRVTPPPPTPRPVAVRKKPAVRTPPPAPRPIPKPSSEDS